MPEEYSDKAVVAALNSCLDLKKFNELPEYVKRRLKELFIHNRLRMVCFFHRSGFGLRVYEERGNFTFDGDLAWETPGTDGQLGKVDIEGCWMECPADEFKVVKWHYVMSKTGRRFYDGSTEVDDETGLTNPWRATRNGAKKMSLEEATRVAEEVGGLVIEAD